VLTTRHCKKYTDIKNYYNEIINTNMDIIKQLKEQLNDAKNEDNIKMREKNRQEEANNQVVGPLQKASEDVQNLKKQRDRHEKICNELVKCQEEIIEMERGSKEVEWGYEVRLQQF
jgi:Sec-independent protein translocase protein TatA